MSESTTRTAGAAARPAGLPGRPAAPRPYDGRHVTPAAAGLGWGRYLRGQFQLSWRVFWRNRRSTFIGFLLPVVLNLVVAAPLRDREIGGVNAAGYTTVGFIGLAMVTSFVNLLNAVVARRDELVLKRLRGTEVPQSAIFAGQLAVSAVVLLIQSVILGAVSVIWFHAPLPADPALFLLALALGYLVFGAFAFALAGFTPSAETSPLVATPVLLLCMFGAGVFTPLQSLPAVLRAPARDLPLAPVIQSLRTAWFGRDFGRETWDGAALRHLGLVDGWQSAAPGLLITLAWLAAAVMVTRRFFRWEPRRG
ncbi:ABC transporter permease [Streptomyces sp. NBC_01476]|uniref:ABC transporter permease n=1 Tax=Streptomyces sp. NBC_01476 TaxID=2903881 RepID=UPI002E3266C4|nr:ABC transporter permease [Streptomyces sp. NBC_01476]